MFRVLLFITLLGCNLQLAGQAESIWYNQNEPPPCEKLDIEARSYRLFNLDTTKLKATLWSAPEERKQSAKDSKVILQVPDPDGNLLEFRIVNYRMMEDGLATRYPYIKTLKGVGVDNKRSTIRLDWTLFGFHAVVRTASGTFYIDPFNRAIKDTYIVYHRQDAPQRTMECLVDEEFIRENGVRSPNTKMFGKAFGDCQFRTYRLAQATTGEYSNFHGAFDEGDVGLVMSAVTTVINRVNDVYEVDMTVRLILVDNTDDVFFYDPATDPYTNNNGVQMLGQNQTTCDNIIGSANYDIGHVFSTGGGGVANLNGPCNNNIKARGVTGLPSPVGDPFSIDYVSHEMGHQFGANHTQNNPCNRNANTAMEPGSASTIMGYAGICNPNVQSNSDDYMHAVSLAEMANFITGSGNSCAEIVSYNNTAPLVDGGTDHLIPVSTPFVLTADATDAEEDPLTYCWEQYDNETGFPMPPQSTSTGGPMFRSLQPDPSPSRYFPNLADLTSGVGSAWETLPSVSRNMTFRITVRDNHPEAGCVSNDQISVSTTADAGPFLIIAPNGGESLNQGEYTLIEWDVANTNVPPVSCTEVDILLSTDGGFTYPITLASNVENNGYHFVQMPNEVSGACRIKVICSGSIFFDISDVNFSVSAGGSTFTLGAEPAFQSICLPGDADLDILTASIGGFSGNITLSLVNAPPGVSASFSPNPVAAGQSSSITITGLDNFPIGSNTIDIQGSSGSTSQTVTLPFNFEPGGASVSLTDPVDEAVDVSPYPSLKFDLIGEGLFNEIQLANDPFFFDLVGTFQITETTLNITNQLESETTYYWRVRSIADCGPGEWSEGWSFTTSGCESYISEDVPVNIPSNAATTVTSTLFIPDNGVIQNVDVIDLTGTHTWINDLIVTLISPAGTEVRLFDQVCWNQNDFFVSFSDQASLTNLPCPPTSGLTYQPEDPLSDFIGENMNGTWTLQIEDVFPEDGGDLLNWQLNICAEGLIFLPLDWIRFDVEKEDKSRKNVLTWKVANHEDNEGFEVQRSVGQAHDFEAVEWMADNALDKTRSTFTYTDQEAPSQQIVYYRVKQVDHDGAYSYSPIRAVRPGFAGDDAITVYPNPFADRIFVTTKMDLNSGSTYELINTKGQVVQSDVVPGEQWSIDSSRLLPGMYFFRIITGNQVESIKIVK